MTDELITNALALYSDQFSDSQRIKDLTASLLKPLLSLRTSFEQLEEDRWIDTAEGVQLDELGAILGVARKGRTDSEYRLILRFQIFINTSKTEPETLIKATRVLSGGTFIRYWENPDAGFHLFTDGPNIINISTSSTEMRLFQLSSGDLYVSNDDANILFRALFRQPDSLVSFLSAISAAGVDYVLLSFSLGETPLFGFGSESVGGRLKLYDDSLLEIEDDDGTANLEIFTESDHASADGFLGFAEIGYAKLRMTTGRNLGVKVDGEIVPLYVYNQNQSVGGGKMVEATRDF
jgi:hypothetical protein